MHDSWTRRRLLAAGAATALTLLAACSDDDGTAATVTNGATGAGDTVPPTAAPEPSTTTPGVATTAPTPTTEPSNRGTRIVTTDRGPIEVPATVSRLVCADYYGAFPAVDVGIVPVGIGGGPSDVEPYASALAGAAIVGDYVEPDPEQVAAATPDVILRTIDTDDATYEQLAKIAPTAVISFQGISLTDVVRRVGELVDRADDAEALVAAYEARGNEIHDRFADVIDVTTWATVSAAADSQWFLLSPAWTDNEAIAAAGIRFSDAVVAAGQQDDYSLERSLEQLDLLADADVLLVTQTYDGEGIDSSMEVIVQSPLWSTLPAVQRGNVFPIPQGTSSLGMALTLLDALEALLPSVTLS